MERKIQRLLERMEEVEAFLGQPNIFDDQKKYRTLSQEHAFLLEVNTLWSQKKTFEKQILENQELLKSEKDFEFSEMLREDNQYLQKQLVEVQEKIENLLVPSDPNDHRPTIIEIRAGTGGDEAALFVGDCVRMYKLYADRKGWQYELLSCTPSEIGGFKEYVMVVSGTNAHRFLQFEAGTHRVQRVPQTEAQGRVHTSAITVAAFPEPEESGDINLDPRELRIDTYRASGAGGQHINTTDSAVRITHIPTGTVVYCQQERSQHKNKDKAMRLLVAKLAEIEEQKRQDSMSSTRANQIGSGDRSERIRTYNFPQNRLTDHRILLTKFNLDAIMNGDLDCITFPLVAHFYQEKLDAEEVS